MAVDEGVQLSRVLSERFGLEGFRPGQEEVVRVLLEGRPALAVFPTGGGKSLCYQLPALMLDGMTLVVSPLIALMREQVERLRERGIEAAKLDSGMSAAEVGDVVDRIKHGRLRLLYVAPERLANAGFRALLREVRPVMAAIDEAHCISEWGHNFRPDYLRLARVLKRLGVKRILALTATATPKVAADIRRTFGIRKSDHVQLSFHRRNLELRILPCEARERRDRLVEALRRIGPGSVVVYVTRQETAEEVATFLVRQGVRARAYHAGLPDDVRADAQDAFMRSEGGVDVIVATIAFGMGVDKPDIRGVIHYNPPKSLENYAQEIGRAGRDGTAAVCAFLACGDDVVALENFVYGDTPSGLAVRSLVGQVLGLGDEFDISLYELSVANDVRQSVVATFLAYLELEGLIEATRPRYSVLKVRMARPLEAILSGFDARRKVFLRRLFEAGESGRIWIRFEIDRIAGELGVARGRIEAAIGYLEEAGDIVVQRSGLRHGFRRRQDPGKLSEVAERLHGQFVRREAQDLARLRDVIRFAETDECLTRRLVGYFGEKMDGDCGHCDRCGGVTPIPVPRTAAREPSDDERRRIRALIDERLAPLRSPRQVARFLCGLSSPAATAARLWRHDDYGMLQDIPFADVLIVTRSMME